MNQQQVQMMLSFMANFNAGLRQLVDHCSAVYPKESYQPICHSTEKSFLFKSGPDPLDHIYIYKNPGIPHQGIPRHWHYIGLGLSDIHGYSLFCRLHEECREQDAKYAQETQPLAELYPRPPQGIVMNGFGLELTLRLKCNSDEEWNQEPPGWPRQIMQDLSRYVFQSRNIFSVGDHVAWHCPLDSEGDTSETSRIRHILMTLDPQLKETATSLGPVKFIQIVGVCQEELQAAREYNVRGILEMMREREDTGGPFLITDMRRGETIFELNLDNINRLEEGIRQMGSDMAQISAKHKTTYLKPRWFKKVEELQNRQEEVQYNDDDPMLDVRTTSILNNDLNEVERGNIFSINRDEGNTSMVQDYPVRTPSRMSQGSESALKIENAALFDARYYDNIYILLSYESAKVLPIMLNGRLAHKRHFSFQSFKGDSLITFQPEGSSIKSLVGPQTPFAKQGHWLQIYVSDELRKQMLESTKEDFSRNSTREQLILPKNYSWPEFNLHLTVVEEIWGD